MKRFALLVLPLSVLACGDNNDENRPIDAAPDSQDIDAPMIDAVDAPPPPIDAPDGPPPLTYSGTISLLEAQVLNPGTSGTYFGQGVQIGIGFSSSDTNVFPGPIMEETPGSPLGCKAWRYTPAQAAAVTIGLDEGPIQITTSGGAMPPTYPACAFTAGIGYTCPHTGTFSTGGIIGVGPAAGTATLTDLDTTFNAGNTTNRYVNISGATNLGNNGTFPIVGLAGANTIVYGNPGFVAETIPATGGHINLAGVGPTPMVPDPGFLPNDVDSVFTLAAGASTHFPAGFAMTTGVTTVGDDFAPAIADLNRMNALPNDGLAFTLTACTAAECPAGSPTASGTLVNIITTDTPVTGLSPFAMPPPTTFRYQVRCAALGAGSIAVPDAYSALLMTSGATRIQTILIRPRLMGTVPVTAVSGHAIVGFTTR